MMSSFVHALLIGISVTRRDEREVHCFPCLNCVQNHLAQDLQAPSVKLPKDGADTARHVSRAASGRNVWKYRVSYLRVVEGHGFKQVLRNNVIDENPKIFFSANFVSFF